MTQATTVIANGSGAVVRAAINSALEAVSTLQSGSSAPSPTYQFMWWADTANDLLKQRNAANSAWVTIGDLATERFGIPVDIAINDFRLTLTSGTPVTTSDVTGGTTIYCTPHGGNQISLYDGTRWNVRTSAEFSLALGTLTASLPYDVFCYDNSGTPTLEFLAWTDDTTRATALTHQDGILVKSGDATRRYLGTFYTTSTTTTEDSATKRYVWNYYNRARRHLYRFESAISWNYTTNAWRQANNNAANQVEWICGVAEDAVDINICVSGSNTAFSWAAIGIGIDSVSAPTRGAYMAPYPSGSSASVSYSNTLLGRHYASWLERAQATGTMSWYGADATLVASSGLTGSIMG